MLQLAKEAIADAQEPAALLAHFSFTARLRSAGAGKIDRLEQLDVLRPFFHLFEDLGLLDLLEVCVGSAVGMNTADDTCCPCYAPESQK